MWISVCLHRYQRHCNSDLFISPPAKSSHQVPSSTPDPVLRQLCEHTLGSLTSKPLPMSFTNSEDVMGFINCVKTSIVLIALEETVYGSAFKEDFRNIGIFSTGTFDFWCSGDDSEELIKKLRNFVFSFDEMSTSFCITLRSGTFHLHLHKLSSGLMFDSRPPRPSPITTIIDRSDWFHFVIGSEQYNLVQSTSNKCVVILNRLSVLYQQFS
ncbi:hypothetical protein GEMRC1_003890 [Eukaryota sp. GEM-RC1]